MVVQVGRGTACHRMHAMLFTTVYYLGSGRLARASLDGGPSLRLDLDLGIVLGHRHHVIESRIHRSIIGGCGPATTISTHAPLVPGVARRSID